ncbi:MAG: homocysteine S-methyltransferase family protein [Bilophila sp.]
MADFRTALAAGRPLVLDGAMGTMLQARGLPAGEHPERFCLDRPDVLKGIHADYIRAGADVILTSTFGGTRFKLPEGLDVVAFNRTLARIARAAADEASHPVFVAGDMGPCGLFVKPLGELDPCELLEGYREQVRGLVAGGVDLLIVETQFDLAEVRLAVAAIRAECDLPVLVSMTFENGLTLTGTTPEIYAETMQNLGVDAIGLNCGAGPEEMAPLVRRLLTCSTVPVFAEPNAGLPELVDGTSVFRLPPAAFAPQTAAFASMGARLVGGCCGTTPEHIRALRKAVDNAASDTSLRVTPASAGGVVLTTRTALVRLGGTAGQLQPLTIIGERINPTGKKDLQAELLAGEYSLALRFAAEQIAFGAPILDVNVGAPLADETVLLPELTSRLTGKFGVPLSLDSSNAAAIAAALPFCPGSALVNSISGETGRMEHLGPLCRQWGAPFVLLPLQGKKLPVTASERIAIIEKLLLQAEALGIPRRLIMVDVLALSVASKAEAAREGLATIRWCTEHQLPTVIGLSNISFGLPARELVNATFLAMSMGAGLAACIANPANGRLREAKAASDVLMGYDRDAAAFVNGYATWHPGNGGSADATVLARTVAVTLEDAVLLGDRENVVALVEQELDAGADPFELVRGRLIPAITEVGARYERREYFLPQLLRSAETMQTAFARLKPLLEHDSEATEQPVAVFATVEGDIHDIGKNIVSLLLGNHGFNVVDLGKDVKAETIIAAAVEHKAAIIGLSALMTTTMIRMQDTIALVKERGLDVQVMVGGAVVTPAFAEQIGAMYSTDAVDAVRLAKSIVAARKQKQGN